MENKDPRSYAIIGAAMEVHAQLGHGFLEAVYSAALEEEFKARQIPFMKEFSIPVFYKHTELPASYRADFLCFNSVIVEIKALGRLGGLEKAQVINYLKASHFQTGILLNFGARSLEYQRVVFSQSASSVKSADG